MSGLKNPIIIFDIVNRQEQYALCLEIIKTIERKKAFQQEFLKRIQNKISIKIGEVEKIGSLRYLEQPMELMERDSAGSSQIITRSNVINKHTADIREISDLANYPGALMYQIRIHTKSQDRNEIDQSKFIHLQYLALLLKNLEELLCFNKPVQKKIMIFVVPTTGKTYPYRDENGKIDCDTYHLLSQYLRLLSANFTGVIYGALEEGKKVTVTALDFKKNRKYETYFPVVLVDEETYRKLFDTYSLKDSIEELFSLLPNRRFRASRDEHPNIALCDFLLETSMRHIRTRLADISQKDIFVKTRLALIKDVLLAGEEQNIMQFCLFSFMLCIENEKTDEEILQHIRNTWQLAHEVCQGMKQIIQNSIQYSQMKGCFLSFYLHEQRSDEDITDFNVRMGENYACTQIQMQGETRLEALEVYIADINENEDMLENFINNLNYEVKVDNDKSNKALSGHRELIKHAKQLAIRNFFSEYQEGDLIKEWKDFRCNDIVAHVGLSLFALVAKRCRASLKVMSNKEVTLSGARNYFYKSYSSSKSVNENAAQENYVIPGTQFSILLPIHAWKNNELTGLGQLLYQNRIVESYASFADFIDYKEERDSVTQEEIVNTNSYNIIDSAHDKYEVLQIWVDFWHNRLDKALIHCRENRECVYNHDFNDVNREKQFSSPDNMELCMKAMIVVMDQIADEMGAFFMAVTNLPTGCLEIFRKICILLGARNFPTNLQLCLCEQSHDKMMILSGGNIVSAIYNSYILSLEHGMNGFSRTDYEDSYALRNQLFTEEAANETSQNDFVKIFPFDAVITCSEENKQIIFEEHIKNIAENPLDHDTTGYKLNDTHMRLGNKVHIESFYEMSFLFYRTTIANRIAFIILRHMLEEGIDVQESAIMFYGYASYSKAILTSLTEILKIYRLSNGSAKSDQVAFASYQHNLQLESEEIQMYFGMPENFPGELDDDNRLQPKEDIMVIQIVPISSTLTTFEKMWNMFSYSIVPELQHCVKIEANYTVFWVVDEDGIVNKGILSDIEKKYWENVTKKHTIQTRFKALKNAGNEYIRSFIHSTVNWHNPLKCDLCYPDRVIEEFPLVETDPTSTVPAQQIRYKSLTNYREIGASAEEVNSKRILELKDCIFYGHICRRQNHYQYYVDTQKYFYKVKGQVKTWLETLSGKLETDSTQPILHIIFSPEHNTNVGFAQYVNTYYFGGLAEIISVNVDKEFRSNFKCEHAALIKMIKDLHSYEYTEGKLPVKFYFVDDTVITGETFEKANSFMHSLIPESVRNDYPATLFSKVFLLVDRLSDDTKYMYVEQIQDNFLSFVHIDISNIRTKGNSCIGCDLENRAQKMFKRSATKKLASYWAQKMNDYEPIPYDDRAAMRKLGSSKAYCRLVISHVLQNIIIKSGKNCDMGSAYDIFLNLCSGMLTTPKEWKARTDIDADAKGMYGYANLLKEIRGIDGITDMIKALCRPFFSYEYKFKTQVLTFVIFLTECILGEQADFIAVKDFKSRKFFLYDNNRDKRTEALAVDIIKNLKDDDAKTDFLQNCLLEGLTDMGSTYLMRKITLKKMYRFMSKVEKETKKEEFWDNYAIYIHRLLTNSADETKEVWIETLYMTGKEYREFVNEKRVAQNNFTPKTLYETITGKATYTADDVCFYQFCCELFLQNTGLNFDGWEKLQKVDSQDMEDDYFMDCWKQMHALSQFTRTSDSDPMTDAGSELFRTLKEVNDSGEKEPETRLSVNQWYMQLLNQFANAIHEKYPSIRTKDINIALVTENLDETEPVELIQRLDIVKERLNMPAKDMPAIRYEIKSQIIAAITKKQGFSFDLHKNGYFIDEKDNYPYCIVFFDNPNLDVDTKAGRSLSSIERVYLYFSIKRLSEKEDLNFIYLQMILRDILMFRNRILRFLERDFTGDIFARYAHTVGEKSILSHEKAVSHSASTVDEISIEIFVNKEAESAYKCLTKDQKDLRKEWLLLRNYTNAQIAKIFNRSFSNTTEDDSTSAGNEANNDAPALYINDRNIRQGKKLYWQKLTSFSDLKMEEDGRFLLLKQVMTIDYDDVKEAEFIASAGNDYYNQEYMRCILLDICLSAIKYKTSFEDFLLRIDRLLYIENKYRELKCRQKKAAEREEPLKPTVLERIANYEEERCALHLFRKRDEEGDADFLVIRNYVDKCANDLLDWKARNVSIRKRLQDPFDYIDGHMSLLAIKRYIENMPKSSRQACWFQYAEGKSEYGEKEGLYFETGLPILKKENSKNE